MSSTPTNRASMIEIEREIDRALIQLADFILEMAYLPPFIEAVGGRAVARSAIVTSTTQTPLTDKMKMIYTAQNALSALIERFTSLWVRGFTETREFKLLEQELVKAGFMYVGKRR